jgi:CTP synthase
VPERHRHRYEFNNEYRSQLEKLGMVIAGVEPAQDLVEIIEIKNHPWFVACQFHPEFKSRPVKAHPLFRDFVKAAIRYERKTR